MSTTPSIFLAHGAPPLLDDAVWMKQLNEWAQVLPKPKSILMISAHWEERPVTLGATTVVPLVYDFYNFPQRFYEMKYPAPGAPELAARVKNILSPSQSVASDPERGLDHGAYIPLMAMYPDADVPVLQISIPTMDPKTLIELGRTLAPLRDEGVLIVGSGFLVHNLRAFFDGGRAPKPPREAQPAALRSAVFDPHATTTPAWSSEFDAWAADALLRRDESALIGYRENAPGVRMALPTHEHFVPVLVALGASLDHSEPVTFPITGTWFGSFTKRSVQFG